MRIVITDGGYATYEAERQVAASVGAELDIRACRSEDDVIAAARDADAIIVRQSPVGRRVIEALERCRVIARYGTGVDNIDIPAATRRGIVVANVVGFGDDEVAEHAIALLLAGARRIVAHDRAVRVGAWDIAQADRIHRIGGSTLGIVGYGAIGRTVHRKLSGFEMRVLVCDAYVDAPEIRGAGAEPVDLETLLREADLITLHAPLTTETHHLIDASALRLVKPTAILANTARGGLIDTAALIEALEDGRLAAAGLDVHEEEPLPLDHPIRRVDRAILLDHAAWYSEEAMAALQGGAADAVAAVLGGRRPASVVNPEVYDEDETNV